MTSYRITAQPPDGAVQEVRVEAPNLASAFRAASAWARVDEEPATDILVGPIEDGRWTWVCSRCQAEGPPEASEGAAHRDADNFHRHCQEG